ncbi:Branchpoint-bridging protein [Kalmusia sp. IMI 367209]|nr:Branchpoint-bridging protein [Kalmusia sp. IMI 367209]
MSWRNQGITGSNNIPLGNRRRIGGDSSGDDGGYNPAEPSTGLSELKRGRSPTRGESCLSASIDSMLTEGEDADGPRRRKKRNRWGDASENKAAGLMGLPTAIYAAMTTEQLDAYTLHLRIEEITQKLKINDVVPADGDRSPSPPPQYDNYGRRVNTREFRYRKRLEDERHKLVEKAMKTLPNYHPPADYRRPTKTQEKVYVPVNDYPEINFIGLLIGPRGNTLKKMESESGAKIAIRGKGSVKEGKGRSDAAHTSNQEEDLHCLIMADTEDKVNKAKKLIHNVIETIYTNINHQQAASIPEGQNELKRNQLRELAALNGTLRDDENQACQNCGEIGHRKYDCPQKQNYTASIICRVCGQAGHMARDCPQRKSGSGWRNDNRYGDRAQARIGGAENELDSFLNEMGGGDGGQPAGAIEYNANGGGYGGEEQRAAKPWEQRPTGAPAPWARNNRDDHDSNAAPWASAGGAQQSGDHYNQGGYNGGAAAPWASSANASYGYGNYGYDQHGAPGAAPPGMSSYGYGTTAQQAGPPPGLGPLFQNYGGSAGSPPLPTWICSTAASSLRSSPPPPPSDAPPPPPPS